MDTSEKPTNIQIFSFSDDIGMIFAFSPFQVRVIFILKPIKYR